MTIYYSLELDKAIYVEDTEEFEDSSAYSDYEWEKVNTLGVLEERAYKELMDFSNDEVYIVRGYEDPDDTGSPYVYTLEDRPLDAFYEDELEDLIGDFHTLKVDFRVGGFEVADRESSKVYGVSAQVLQKAIRKVKAWYQNFPFLELDLSLYMHCQAWYSNELFGFREIDSGALNEYGEYSALYSKNDVSFFVPFIVSGLIKTIQYKAKSKARIIVLDDRTEKELYNHRLDRSSALLLKKADPSKRYRFEFADETWFEVHLRRDESIVIFSDEAYDIVIHSPVVVNILPLLQNEILGGGL